MPRLSPRQEFLWVAGIAAALSVLSYVGCNDRVTWLLEAAPVLFGVGIAWRWPLAPSRMLSRLMLLHAIVLLVGAHWTYARVPAGFWVQDLLGLARNHYDRLGHVIQGVVPALIFREALLRRPWVASRPAAAWLAFGCTLGFSAAYELVEWSAAVALGGTADAFLGTQGDPWDTQSDMALAALGAAVAMTCLTRAHDRSIAAG